MHSYEHMVADLVALYKKLNIEKASVIGHSMGGRAMMLLALQYVRILIASIIFYSQFVFTCNDFSPIL